jgi:type IV secretory pathway protease TraF
MTGAPLDECIGDLSTVEKGQCVSLAKCGSHLAGKPVIGSFVEDMDRSGHSMNDWACCRQLALEHSGPSVVEDHPRFLIEAG